VRVGWLSLTSRHLSQYTYGGEMWYVDLESQGNKVRAFVEDILTFIILYNNLIPIS
jgi:phospholipid-transporting ATPase